MELKMEAIYNKTLSATALIGFIAFLLLSLKATPFSPIPIYGAIAFAAIMFTGYFLTNYLLYGQDPALFILACFITELGLIMLYRINPAVFLKQINWFALGVLAFILSSIVIKYWVKLQINPLYFFVITIILLVIPLVFGVEKGGSRSWIQLAGYSFQPSELAKITFVLFLAGRLKDGRIDKVLWLTGEVLAAVGLLALARDLGGAMLFYLTALALVFAATSRWDLTAAGLAVSGVAAVLGYYLFGHVRVRVEAWLNPWQDVPGRGYQIVQSLFAIAQGGFFGTGLGLGHPEYIPAVTTDFIFSGFSEEFGFLGAAALIIVYFLLVYRGIKISLTVRDSFLALVALGISTLFGLQIFTIIGGVIKLIPMTGVTLPFMSYGGSSMVMSFISLGILNGIRLNERREEADG
ncbi:FtsW/RodA/SpoVE family cell cycle protein [Biomaibacter acetigenes]|uniref:FtsW/RodA/SpoVE family cell cycle protein n=2 Tax=Biomaibacter acetigenes TaxID=2316383 RepID=A0A3G2R822_9FIRM|nr:FtsW/RodA/SpoVE family cell cycle protein [Biomaibacter acetigenes]AYO31591.1 FtsW/RodA/SpoVE family cell cycle protein [Biomaibacter acetigenes]